MKSHTLLAEIKILEAGHYNTALLPNAACLQGCSDLCSVSRHLVVPRSMSSFMILFIIKEITPNVAKFKKMNSNIKFSNNKKVYTMTFTFFKCDHVHWEELLLQKVHQQLVCVENNPANPAPKNRSLAPETKELLHKVSVLYLTPTTSPYQME